MRFKDLPERAIFVSVDAAKPGGPFLRTINYPSFPVRISGLKIGEYVEFNDDDEVFICRWRHTAIELETPGRASSVKMSYDIVVDEGTSIDTTISMDYDPDGVITIPIEKEKEKAMRLKDLKMGDYFRFTDEDTVYLYVNMAGSKRFIGLGPDDLGFQSWDYCDLGIYKSRDIIKVDVDIKSTDVKPLTFEDLDIGDEFTLSSTDESLYLPNRGETKMKSSYFYERGSCRGRYTAIDGDRKGHGYYIEDGCEVRRVPPNLS